MWFLFLGGSSSPCDSIPTTSKSSCMLSPRFFASLRSFLNWPVVLICDSIIYKSSAIFLNSSKLPVKDMSRPCFAFSIALMVFSFTAFPVSGSYKRGFFLGWLMLATPRSSRIARVMLAMLTLPSSVTSSWLVLDVKESDASFVMSVRLFVVELYDVCLVALL